MVFISVLSDNNSLGFSNTEQRFWKQSNWFLDVVVILDKHSFNYLIYSFVNKIKKVKNFHGFGELELMPQKVLLCPANTSKLKGFHKQT